MVDTMHNVKYVPGTPSAALRSDTRQCRGVHPRLLREANEVTSHPVGGHSMKWASPQLFGGTWEP